MANPSHSPPRRGRGPARLSALVSTEIAAVFAKRGFAGADLAVHWPEIAGPGVARQSRPLALTWPKGGAAAGLGATLVVACSGGFALDLQQMAPILIERINRRLGWRCVVKLTIRQMPVRPPEPRRTVAAPAPEDVNAAGRIAAGIRKDGLRDAVTRLGAAALARARRQAGNAGMRPTNNARLPDHPEMP